MKVADKYVLVTIGCLKYHYLNSATGSSMKCDYNTCNINQYIKSEGLKLECNDDVFMI